MALLHFLTDVHSNGKSGKLFGVELHEIDCIACVNLATEYCKLYL